MLINRNVLQEPQGGDLYQEWNHDCITEHQHQDVIINQYFSTDCALSLTGLVQNTFMTAKVFDTEPSCPAMKIIFGFPLFPDSHYNLICRRRTFSCTFAILRSIPVAAKKKKKKLHSGAGAGTHQQISTWSTVHVLLDPHPCTHPRVHSGVACLR